VADDPYTLMNYRNRRIRSTRPQSGNSFKQQ
jgi:hypothetical protein